MKVGAYPAFNSIFSGVCWTEFDCFFFFFFFLSPPCSDIPLLKEAWGLLCLSSLLHLGFLPPPLSLPLGQKHSVQSSPSSQAVPWIPPRRDALSWRSKGCRQVASWMHQWSWCSAGFPIPSASGAQGTEWIWALLSSSPARCLTADSEELLFSCAFLLLTPACCSFSAFLALLLPREQGLNPLARWVQTQFKYTYICYIGSSSSILFVIGQDKTPHWDWKWAWEGLQLRGSLWYLEAPQMRWAVWQLSRAGTVHWELLQHWKLRSPTCRNALCPISAGVHSWKSLLSPPSSSTSAAHWKKFRCLKIPRQKNACR